MLFNARLPADSAAMINPIKRMPAMWLTVSCGV
jgi:hypothetical protein